MTTFRTLTTESALIAGFCFAGLALGEDSTTNLLNLGYLASTSTAMGFGLLCITVASFCLMMGPGRALRGVSMEAIDEAVDHMKEKSYLCFKYFMLELFFFHVSSFLLMWYMRPFLTALIVNIILLLFLLLFIANGYEIVKELYVEEGDAVTGSFNTI